jgi:CheY-like chemotaxis protein
MGLKTAGFEVINATNGQEGINQAKSQKPDLILLDQIMPDMLGNEVLQSLKQDPETTPIPVMLISNYNENQMMKDAIAQGAVDYILKYQIETKDLIDKVKSLLTQIDKANVSQTPAPSNAPATPAPTMAAPASTDTPGDKNPTGSA